MGVVKVLSLFAGIGGFDKGLWLKANAPKKTQTTTLPARRKQKSDYRKWKAQADRSLSQRFKRTSGGTCEIHTAARARNITLPFRCDEHRCVCHIIPKGSKSGRGLRYMRENCYWGCSSGNYWEMLHRDEWPQVWKAVWPERVQILETARLIPSGKVGAMKLEQISKQLDRE